MSLPIGTSRGPSGLPALWPWHRSRTTVAVAAALYTAVIAVRVRAGGPADGGAMLFTVPIALIALAFGRRIGLICALPAIALLVAWVCLAQVHLSPIGWVSRVVPMLLVGALVGGTADRLRDSEAERHRLATAAHRHQETVKLTDALVQGLSAAKWALESDDPERGLAIVADTLDRGHRLVCDLIRDAGLGPLWSGGSHDRVAP